MTKDLIIGIDWYGPYSRASAIEEKDQFSVGGLYMAIGTRKGKGNHKRRPLYMGISQHDLVSRCTSANHPILSNINYHSGLWLGEISTAEPSGKKIKVTKSTLDLAEWLHILFMDLPMNTKKKTIPERSAMVINRWWKPDFETPRFHRPHPAWPDLIDFPGREFRARTVWFGKKMVSHPPSEWV